MQSYISYNIAVYLNTIIFPFCANLIRLFIRDHECQIVAVGSSGDFMDNPVSAA